MLLWFTIETYRSGSFPDKTPYVVNPSQAFRNCFDVKLKLNENVNVNEIAYA